ncbi:MAG: hypothetical protein K0A94_06065 [Desulfuromonadales bacterium]|nr:hypothetical protein [Desulfuromonadales bacterium]
MPKTSTLFAVCFVSGLLGALFSSLFLWLGSEWGIIRILGINLSRSIALPALYPLMFAGGLWGLLFFVSVASPRSRRFWIRKSLWVALIPALVDIAYIYPQVQNQGIGGINLGILMPGLIILSWLVWGFFTGFFARLLWGR